jgi:hypothetical protein
MIRFRSIDVKAELPDIIPPPPPPSLSLPVSVPEITYYSARLMGKYPPHSVNRVACMEKE